MKYWVEEFLQNIWKKIVEWFVENKKIVESFSKKIKDAFSNEGKLIIKIEDQGPGISDADKESIFDLFFRSDTTRHIQGQGLGLFITIQILKLHHINLIVDSELGKGTSFSLVFP